MKSEKLQRVSNFWKKLTTGSVNRQILGAALIVAFGTGLVKISAIIKELVVAWRFGTGNEVDAFLIALVIPEFIKVVVAGSFDAAFIPTYIQVREKEGMGAAQRLFSGATLCSLGLLGITTILLLVTSSLYLPKIALGFSPEKLSLTYELLFAISPIVALSGLLATWSAVLNAGERFALASITPLITPSITIALILFARSWGVFALSGGLAIGAFLELVILGKALQRQGICLRPKWHGLDIHLRQVMSQYLPMITGSFLMCSSNLVDSSMAANLSAGSVAALSYGYRLTSTPLSLMTTALGTAVIPYFSKMIARKDWKEVNRTLHKYMKSIFIVAIPITLLLIVFSENIIQILFQRGAFTASDTHLVAQIQICFALQIPFYVATMLVVRLIESMRLSQIFIWGSSFNLMINIVLNYVFSRSIGVAGIALSTTCVYIFSFSFLSLFIMRQLKKIQTEAI